MAPYNNSLKIYFSQYIQRKHWQINPNLEPESLAISGTYSYREIAWKEDILAYTVLYKCQDFHGFNVFYF